MNAYFLHDMLSGSWRPHPGDLIWIGSGSVNAQWPPDGLRWFDANSRAKGQLEFEALDRRHPLLVLTVEVIGTKEVPIVRTVVWHRGRFWWVPCVGYRGLRV